MSMLAIKQPISMGTHILFGSDIQELISEISSLECEIHLVPDWLNEQEPSLINMWLAHNKDFVRIKD